MVAWTGAILIELQRSGSTDNILGDVLIGLGDTECGEKEGWYEE